MKLKSVAAMMCVYLVLNAQAAVSQNDSRLLASRAVSQSVVAANGLFSGTRPSSEQILKIANTMSRFIDKSKAEGRLAESEKVILAHAHHLLNEETFRTAHTDQVFNSLQSNGWVGSREHVASMMSRLTLEQRVSLVHRVRTEGIEPLMREAVNSLRQLANMQDAFLTSPNSPDASYVPIRLIFVDGNTCDTFEGGFLALLAIGAVASLGGVNPLGDLLGAIGAVGELVTYIGCHHWVK